MTIREIFEQDGKTETSQDAVLPRQPSNKVYLEIKSRIHRKLLDRINLSVMESMPPDRLKEELKTIVERLCAEEPVAINDSERALLVRDIQHEVLGLGPLEVLLADPTVDDILVNTCQYVYVERHGKLELTDVHFENDAHLLKIIDKIVSGIGRRVDESSPMVDARLPTGSRVNAIIPPLAIDGPILSIRRFAVDPYRMGDFIRFKTLVPEMSQVLEGLVKSKVNLLVSGGTGTGKTTLLNILSSYIEEHERVITIEDAAELQLQQRHVVRLETRPPNIEGRGEIPMFLLVRNSLRMRPDRIIVGEVRGAEVLDMLQAMNTGHEGSMTTVHANSPRDALIRLENMIGMAATNMSARTMRHQISSAITVVIHLSRLRDGKRKVTSIQEITGMEGEIVTMQEIFSFKQTGIAEDGSILGHFQASGVRPKFVERLKVNGIMLDEGLFDPTRFYS